MEMRSDSSVSERNREFYDGFWSRARLTRPERFNTWPVISVLLPSASSRLEIGPGLHPRLPIEGTHFVDLSERVIDRLKAAGGDAVAGDMTRLPFDDATFDLIAGFDVFEHIEDDRRVFSEVTRVLKDGGTLIFSVPLHRSFWTEFDRVVGHVRRYEPPDLLALVAEHQLVLEKSAGFGMKPSSGRMVGWGMWWLAHHPERAMRWYNRVLLPLGMFLQKPLRFSSGLIDTDGIQGLVLVCRRLSGRPPAASCAGP